MVIILSTSLVLILFLYLLVKNPIMAIIVFCLLVWGGIASGSYIDERVEHYRQEYRTACAEAGGNFIDEDNDPYKCWELTTGKRILLALDEGSPT